jgi:hypothetical protein
METVAMRRWHCVVTASFRRQRIFLSALRLKIE